MLSIRGMMAFYGRKIQVSELKLFPQIHKCCEAHDLVFLRFFGAVALFLQQVRQKWGPESRGSVGKVRFQRLKPLGGDKSRYIYIYIRTTFTIPYAPWCWNMNPHIHIPHTVYHQNDPGKCRNIWPSTMLRIWAVVFFAGILDTDRHR